MGKSIGVELLICPFCKSKVQAENSQKISCISCHSEFYYENNILLFKKFNNEVITDELDRLKTLFKKWNNLYDFLIKVLSPVFIQMNLKKFIKDHTNDETIAINLGSGNSNLSEKITNVDIFPYENVNVCCDVNNIPIAEASVDLVINTAVLEHVTSPENVVDEIYRILKTGGIVYTYFPFIQPYHASPYDYSRRTIEGLKILHKRFDIKEVRIGAGPTSGFLWVLQEWLAILLSFGIKRIHHYVYLLVMVVTFPLKYLDLILSRFSTSNNISSAFILIARKK
ncbi:MAG: class I SAM-dependent methyltransferase [Bacteroidales bacterium]|nr:class I SAM-dependent methyltransferase [Bacteroidales bacterium]